MDLDRYLDQTTEKRFARRAKTSIATINRLRHKQRRASVAKALQIEIASDGKVRAEDLPMSTENRRTVREYRRWISQQNGGVARSA